MNTSSEDLAQSAKPHLSIADRCAVTYNHNGLDAILLETDNLADAISRTIGAKAAPDCARGDLSPAYELASLLSQIRCGIVEGDRRTLPTIDAAIELAFLHSGTYRLALQIFTIEASGRFITPHEVSGSDAFEMLGNLLQPSLDGIESEREKERQAAADDDRQAVETFAAIKGEDALEGRADQDRRAEQLGRIIKIALADDQTDIGRDRMIEVGLAERINNRKSQAE